MANSQWEVAGKIKVEVGLGCEGCVEMQLCGSGRQLGDVDQRIGGQGETDWARG